MNHSGHIDDLGSTTYRIYLVIVNTIDFIFASFIEYTMLEMDSTP